MPKTARRGTRRTFLKGAAAATLAIGMPMIARGEAKAPLKIGQPTILSGRIAQLGEASRNGATLMIEEFNAAGGLDGRMLELVTRDSKGRPDEAARVVRELINNDGCQIIIDAEASSAAFAVQEVVRGTGHLCIHTVSETSSLTADPKLRAPNAFRVARQGIHDSIVGGRFAAKIAKEKGLKRWMSCSPDYAYGRDTSAQFFEYVKQFEPSIEMVGATWPKLGAPDYTENVTNILQTKPEALYSALYAGDLVSFIDQGNLYGLFDQVTLFDPNTADYTTLRGVKKLPKGTYSGNRYLTTFPASPANAAWGAAYEKRFKVPAINWSWENATAVAFLIAAMKKTGSADNKVLADAMRGMTIDSPIGTNGKVTLRAEDQTLIDYAIGWGTTIPTEPYVTGMEATDWSFVTAQETEWKKRSHYL